MDKILTCKVNTCGLYLVEPVLLPCGYNVCKSHTINLKREHFDCDYCNEYHLIPSPDGFPLNVKVQELIEKNLHLSEDERNNLKLIEQVETELRNFNDFIQNSDKFIDVSIASVEKQINVHRDKIINNINDSHKKLIDDLNLYKSSCKKNTKKSNSNYLTEKYKNFNLEIANKCKESREKFKSPQSNCAESSKLIEKISDSIYKNESQIKAELLQNKTMRFIPNEQTKAFGRLQFNLFNYL